MSVIIYEDNNRVTHFDYVRELKYAYNSLHITDNNGWRTNVNMDNVIKIEIIREG